MTNKEAIENIIAFTVAYVEEDWPVEIGEALGMAISALSENNGEWILKCEFPIRWECSHCHTSSYELLNYCPNCGADMRGKAE